MSEIEFENNTGDDISFCDGVISSNCYSYHIDSWGSIELSKEDTRKLFEFMKKYYDEQPKEKCDETR